MDNEWLKLRDYQKEISKKAEEILREKGIIYLSMQTRTGKTLTSFEIVRLSGKQNCLFVTKKKAIKSILKDYEHYKESFNCTVINYESVMKVANNNYDIAIIDEAHSLGAFPKPSKRYIDLKKIVSNIPVILMSATPSPESFSQLYHQFTINKSHSWSGAKNFYHWAKYYVNVKKKYYYNREINDYSEAKEDLIKNATQDYFIAFSQTEAGIKKQVQERILFCNMKSETVQLIKKLQKNKVIEFSEGSVVLADTAVKEMSKVHQLSSGTVKTESGDYLILDKSKAEYIKNAFPNKVIAIFYKFIAEREILREIFPGCTETPEELQEGKSDTFIGQFQSAREGIRLDRAEYIIFYNIDFSFLSYEQSKNRIVSKEREKDAYLFFIFNSNGIERKIYDVVKNKQDYTTEYYKKDYYAGIQNSIENNKTHGVAGVVCRENNTVQQKRIPGFDMPAQRKGYFH